MPVIGFLGSSALADRARYLSAFRQGIRETSDFDPNEFKIKYSSFVKTPILDIIRRRGHHSSVLHPGRAERRRPAAAYRCPKALRSPRSGTPASNRTANRRLAR